MTIDLNMPLVIIHHKDNDRAERVWLTFADSFAATVSTHLGHFWTFNRNDGLGVGSNPESVTLRNATVEEMRKFIADESKILDEMMSKEVNPGKFWWREWQARWSELRGDQDEARMFRSGAYDHPNEIASLYTMPGFESYAKVCFQTDFR